VTKKNNENNSAKNRVTFAPPQQYRSTKNNGNANPGRESYSQEEK
jgi:hypothetical protein